MVLVLVQIPLTNGHVIKGGPLSYLTIKSPHYLSGRHVLLWAALQSPPSFINSFIKSLILCENILRRRHDLMIRDGASTHKIDYIEKFKENINLKGHQNCNIASKVTAILL